MCITFSVLGFLFYFLVITGFSAQDAESSGSLSLDIAEKLANFLLPFRMQEPEDVFTFANYFEHPLRKIAHFTEYALLGGLFSASVMPLMCDIRDMCNGKARHIYIRISLFVAVLAAFDELHQYFVPGRYASVWDVLLDTFGCVIACFVLYLKSDRKKRKKRNE